jgi:hypothetical protein
MVPPSPTGAPTRVPYCTLTPSLPRWPPSLDHVFLRSWRASARTRAPADDPPARAPALNGSKAAVPRAAGVGKAAAAAGGEGDEGAAAEGAGAAPRTKIRVWRVVLPPGMERGATGLQGVPVTAHARRGTLELRAECAAVEGGAAGGAAAEGRTFRLLVRAESGRMEGLKAWARGAGVRGTNYLQSVRLADGTRTGCAARRPPHHAPLSITDNARSSMLWRFGTGAAAPPLPPHARCGAGAGWT